MNDYNIQWPAFVAGMWSTGGSSVSLPVSGGFLSCVTNVGFYPAFWVVAMSPIVAVCIVFGAALVAHAASAVTKRGRWSWPALRTAVLVLWYLLYPTVTRQAVRVLDCSEDIGGLSYLESDMREECGTSTHAFHVVAALVVIAAFCVGFPAYTALSLRQKLRSGQLDDLATRKQWLFMTQGYRDEYCWWEAVVMARKGALAAAAAALGGSGRGHQAYTAALVLAVCVCAQLAARPYVSERQGRLETASLLVSVGSLYLGLLYVLGGLGSAGSAAVLAVLVLANAAFVVAVVLEVMRRVCSKPRPAASTGNAHVASGGAASHRAAGSVELAVRSKELRGGFLQNNPLYARRTEKLQPAAP